MLLVNTKINRKGQKGIFKNHIQALINKKRLINAF